MRQHILSTSKSCQRPTTVFLVAALSSLFLTASLFSHPDPRIAGARLAVHIWALGLRQNDPSVWAPVLADDLSVSSGATRAQYIELLSGQTRELPVTRMLLHLASYKTVADEIRVEPVVMIQSDRVLVTTMRLTLHETPEGWKIAGIQSDLPVPEELTEIDLPEQYDLCPVTVRIEDRETGEPVGARVHVRDSEGRYWPPQGHPRHVKVGFREDVGGDVVIRDRTYAYVEPEFILPLPLGHYSIEVLRGLEYEPSRVDFAVESEFPPALTVTLSRWSNVRREGWYSGDTHVHFLEPRTAFLEARGEDLNVLNILETKLVESITEVEHFSGGPDPVSEPDHVVYVNEESRHWFLGHTILLNLKNLVYPLSWGGFGDEGVPGGIDYPAMAMQADKTHSQGGFVAWAHFPSPRGELAIDIALGKVDSVDVMTWGDAFYRTDKESPAQIWYRFLNCGFRMPATAGTDKMWNPQVVGIPRTYVKVDGEFGYEKWLDGIRRGRTFVTTGPMLEFSVGGREAGEEITLARDETVWVRAEVSSLLPVEKLEIIKGGQVVAVMKNPQRQRQMLLETEVSAGESSWVAARAYSSQLLPYQESWFVRRKGIPLMAHTSPVYLNVDGKPAHSPEDAAFFLQWVEEAVAWIRNEAKIPRESQRKEMLDLFERAREVYLKQVD